MHSKATQLLRYTLLCAALYALPALGWAQEAEAKSTTNNELAVDSANTADAAESTVELELDGDGVTELNADEDDGGGQNISGLLGAARDVFASQVQFNLSAFRFQERGYSSDYSSIYFNGFSLRDPETGYANYNVWGGLNDVLRGYTTHYGLEASEESYGNFAGITSYTTKASSYRKQTSASAVMSNRTYQYRLMLTTATGLLDNGFAFTASVSSRLGESGYMEGTPYEAYSYFVSAEKQFLKNHSINLTVMGAPREYGMSSAVIQEAYDLYGSYAYNPRWGYQNGEKRTARIRNTHLPMAMLNYTWNIGDGQKLEAGASYLFGRNGTSDLDWSEGNDPRPDYYRKFPSYWSKTNPDLADYYAAQWQAHDPASTQIDWDALVAGNINANAFSAAGDRQAMTIVKEYRNDQQTWRAFANYNHHLNRYISLYGGLEAQRYKGMFFQTVIDALGADYYLNVDKYALSDNVLNVQKAYYDINNPDLKRYVGDKFGYDYNIFQNDYSGWVQAKLSAGRFDFGLAATAGYTEFWRDGKMNNGRFAETGRSFGKSKTEQFIHYAGKANVTFKIDGRNYLSVNGGYEQRPPLFKNTYLQERYHDFTVDDYGMNVNNEAIYSADASYNYRGADLKLRASAYYTQSRNASEIKVFYMEGASSLVEYIAQGIDRRYMGLELGAQYKLSPTLTLQGAAAHGQYTFTNNPSTAVVVDDEAGQTGSDIPFRTAYIEGYHVSQRPGTVGTMSLTYRSPKYWFVGLTASAAGNTYVDINYDRRTYEAMSFLPGTPDYNKQLEQEKFPVAYTLDIFGGYSYRFRNGGIVGFNGNLQNLLDKSFKTGGFEQLRFDAADLGKFPAKYYYSFGRTFFVQVYYRF